MRTRYFLPFVMLLFMTSCTTPSDPRSGGFFGGVHGLATGTYEQRIQEREQNLERLLALQQEMRIEREQLQKNKDDLTYTIIREQQVLSELEQNSIVMLSELNHLDAANAHQQAVVAKLKELVAELQKDIQQQRYTLDALVGGSAEDKTNDLRLKQLIKQRDSLHKEFDLLVEMYTELAK